MQSYFRDITLEFDVMLEAKAKDLALLRLRSDLARIAPDVAARFGTSATDVTPPQAEEIAVKMESSVSGLDM
jgi:UV DNA damage endonuclease